MDKKAARIRSLRTALSLVLVGLYALGLIAMMTFSFQTGLILWVVSTLGGIGLLYWIRTVDKKDAPEGAEGGNAPQAPEGEAGPASEDDGRAGE